MGKISEALDTDREDQRMPLPVPVEAAVPLPALVPPPAPPSGGGGFKKLLISVGIETHTALRIRGIREGKTLEAVSRDILNAGVAQT